MNLIFIFFFFCFIIKDLKILCWFFLIYFYDLKYFNRGFLLYFSNRGQCLFTVMCVWWRGIRLSPWLKFLLKEFYKFNFINFFISRDCIAKKLKGYLNFQKKDNFKYASGNYEIFQISSCLEVGVIYTYNVFTMESQNVQN